MNDSYFIKLAIKQAQKSVDQGGFPAGAVVAKVGKVIAKGLSLGFQINDPTGHAETVAIRKACKRLETSNLNGAVLYASLQPCLMCFSVANWSGISKIVYGCKKSKEMITKHYYEGSTDIHTVNKNNTRKIELVYMADFEKESLDVVQVWEDQRQANPMKVFVGKGKAKEKTDAVKEIKRYYQKSPRK